MSNLGRIIFGVPTRIPMDMDDTFIPNCPNFIDSHYKLDLSSHGAPDNAISFESKSLKSGDVPLPKTVEMHVRTLFYSKDQKCWHNMERQVVI